MASVAVNGVSPRRSGRDGGMLCWLCGKTVALGHLTHARTALGHLTSRAIKLLQTANPANFTQMSSTAKMGITITPNNSWPRIPILGNITFSKADQSQSIYSELTTE